MQNVRFRAILYALVIFSFLFLALEIQGKYVHPYTGQDLLIFWLNLSGFLLFIIPGFTAAKFAKTWGTVHGLVTGLAAIALADLYYSLRYPHYYTDFWKDGWYFNFAFGVVCGGVGGLIWDVRTLLGKLSSKYSQKRSAQS